MEEGAGTAAAGPVLLLAGPLSNLPGVIGTIGGQVKNLIIALSTAIVKGPHLNFKLYKQKPTLYNPHKVAIITYQVPGYQRGLLAMPVVEQGGKKSC